MLRYIARSELPTGLLDRNPTFPYPSRSDKELVSRDKKPAKAPASKALLVEDNANLQRIHTEMLVSLGYEVEVAASGAEALAMANNTQGLILLDIGLPDFSGVEVVRELHHRMRGKIPYVIAATTRMPPELEVACYFGAIKQVLIKPFNLQVLKAAIEKMKLRDQNIRIC